MADPATENDHAKVLEALAELRPPPPNSGSNAAEVALTNEAADALLAGANALLEVKRLQAGIMAEIDTQERWQTETTPCRTCHRLTAERLAALLKGAP